VWRRLKLSTANKKIGLRNRYNALNRLISSIIRRATLENEKKLISKGNLKQFTNLPTKHCQKLTAWVHLKTTTDL